MSSRREFIIHTAAGLASATCLRSASSATKSSSFQHHGGHVRAMKLRDETIVRYPTVNGDNWHLTWAADDRQYASLCDGYGWLEQPPGMYNSRLISVSGNPAGATFQDVLGYPDLVQPFDKLPRYYSFGVIALDERIYQFLSTWNVPLNAEAKDLRFVGVKAIFSRDQGRTWHNQDGSTPVRWEDWKDRSRDSLLFFEEPQQAFSMLSVLQMGKNYEKNRDGYVYIYSPNGNTEGTMNQLVLLRAPKGQVVNRRAYEYFAGVRADGSARWVGDIEGRAVVHTFPSGWVNRLLHPWAWIPSVAYNAAVGCYMMANWATAPSAEPKAEWFDRPSYLGFWTAPSPWGPWTQVYENTSWAPGGDLGARCYSPIIAPKWIAADGKSFWLVWTDFQQKMDKAQLARRQEAIDQLSGPEKIRAAAALDRANRPYYSFNIQRVDIDLA